MDKVKLLECIDFFKKLIIKEEDVTTPEEKVNGQFVVVVTYEYEAKKYTTNRLFYKNINIQRDVKHKDGNNKFFGEPVFWLDIDIHEWPDGSGAKLEDTVIPELVNVGDNDFQEFLKLIANDSRNGFEQEILWDGRSPQYGINLENNNHWHDIILLIQKVIQSNGDEVDKKYFSRLVFEWDENSGARTSLHPQFGSRALIKGLYKNIKSIQMELKNNEILGLLKYKKQIILQGPPGTGKTRMAKEIANDFCSVFEVSDCEIRRLVTIGLDIKTPTGYNTFNVILIGKDFVKVKPNGAQNDYTVSFDEIKDSFTNKHWESQVSENNTNGNASYKIGIAKYVNEKLPKGEYKIIQFHPAYSYEDFVRGIVAVVNSENKLEYKVVNRTIAEYAEKAFYNPSANYVLIIDEINRANLPAVLGELIYALEYRFDDKDPIDTTVESMYALKNGKEDIEGDKSLRLPRNLYIIGTMNTADRSVGHIDYAIRRRFAFVDLLPEISPIREAGIDYFKLVSGLFIKDFDNVNWQNPNLIRSEHLAADFRPEDVILGHSYFITKEIDGKDIVLSEEEQMKYKLKYEIVPILKEYLKDGILNESARDEIGKLC
jgi:MoxR-like ATPase